jgi:cupin fold WbuC family metalloprotein
LSSNVNLVRLIDQALLDELSAEAATSPRLRKNRNFHPSDDFVSHRLLNAVEPGSYVMPHRHLAADKDETIVVLRGRFGVLLFDDAGKVVRKLLLEAGGPVQGVDLPHGTWHTLVALETGSVFFEAKAGPYAPLSEAERAPWAPTEIETAAASRCLGEWMALFGGD